MSGSRLLVFTLLRDIQKEKGKTELPYLLDMPEVRLRLRLGHVLGLYEGANLPDTIGREIYWYHTGTIKKVKTSHITTTPLRPITKQWKEEKNQSEKGQMLSILVFILIYMFSLSGRVPVPGLLSVKSATVYVVFYAKNP